MVFSSITFLFYFLPISLILYYMAPEKTKNFVLLLVSLFFYAWGEPVYVFLMIFSILANYILGLLISKHQGSKAVLSAAVVINLLVIGFFKYADFLIENINGIFGASIEPLEPLELPLPIGISFYTFQAMSYIIDLYRGNVKLQKNIIDFAMYITMFPQLIAGPIVRLKSIEDRLHRRENTPELFAAGVKRFAVGLGKKVLLANNAGIIWDTVNAMSQGEVSTVTAWIGIAAFTFQIYFDFSGYSDMAIGLGKMFGFDFPENFDYPYTSKSITEFWRRWHISLGTWFREYVYIPLGGNRHGIARQILNIAIVWFLTGLWHGASWNFVIWGLYFAVILMMEKLFLLNILEKLPAVARHIYTMVLVIVSWVIFSIESPVEIAAYISAMFGGTIAEAGFFSNQTAYLLSSNWILIAVFAVGCTKIPKTAYSALISRIRGEKEQGKERRLGKKIFAATLENALMASILIVAIAYITASTYNPFLYFRF